MLETTTIDEILTQAYARSYLMRIEEARAISERGGVPGTDLKLLEAKAYADESGTVITEEVEQDMFSIAKNARANAIVILLDDASKALANYNLYEARSAVKLAQKYAEEVGIEFNEKQKEVIKSVL